MALDCIGNSFSKYNCNMPNLVYDTKTKTVQWKYQERKHVHNNTCD